MIRPQSLLHAASALGLATLLAGCNTIVLSPPGDVAAQQGQLIVVATVLMLIVIVPVIALTFWFAWRYRASNRSAKYTPNWDHSTQLELVIWGVPLLIIIALGAVTWISTHLLDPYRPLDRISAGRPVPEGMEPLEIQVVAMDWKWMFFYPEYGVASLNEAAAPIDRPIRFSITSSSVMNAFYVPALAGMIYGMPGMQTTLHAVMNEEGDYEGFSANYSGAGFSHMRFRFHGLSDEGFDDWIQTVRGEGDTLGRIEYLELEKPSQREPVRYFGSVDSGLFSAIVNRCVDIDRLCMDQMMAIDATGGAGVDRSVQALAMPRFGDTRTGPYVRSAVCTITDPAPLIGSPIVGGLQAP